MGCPYIIGVSYVIFITTVTFIGCWSVGLIRNIYVSSKESHISWLYTILLK